MTAILWMKKDGVKVRAGGGSAPPAPSPTPTALGASYSDSELAIWQQRAASGPYKSVGDHNTNSPGSWDNVVARKDIFKTTHLDSLYAGLDPANMGNNVTDAQRGKNVDCMLAAFYVLVMPGASDAADVRGKVVARVATQLNVTNYPNLDGSPTGPHSRSHAITNDDSSAGGYFHVCKTLLPLLIAIDYIGADAWTSTQRQRFSVWAYWWAEFVAAAVHGKMTGSFGGATNRLSGSWGAPGGTYDWVPFLNGPLTHGRIRWMNNRRAAMLMFTHYVSYMLDGLGYTTPTGEMTTATMRLHSAAWFKECIQFGYAPPSFDSAASGKEGFAFDYDRNTSADPTLGLSYGSIVVGFLGWMADLSARHGDRSLFDYATRNGSPHSGGFGGTACQTGDVDKTLEALILQYSRYWSGLTNKRNVQNTGDLKGSQSPQRILDAAFHPTPNLYYQNATIRSRYTRTYPSSPQNNGGQRPWLGGMRSYPDGLFMHGQLEGVVFPYPAP